MKFTAEQHLLRQISFTNILKNAQPVLRGSGIVVYRGVNKLNFARMGVVCPKKRIKSAVRRNAFKRGIREWFRLNQAMLGNIDLLFIVNFDAFAQDKLGVRSKKTIFVQLSELFTSLLHNHQAPELRA